VAPPSEPADGGLEVRPSETEQARIERIDVLFASMKAEIERMGIAAAIARDEMLTPEEWIAVWDAYDSAV
jgi:hypothetical protein